MKPWATPGDARTYVVAVIGEPFWGGLESRVRIGEFAGSSARDAAKLLRAKKEIEKAKQHVTAALGWFDQTIGALINFEATVRVRSDVLAGLKQLEQHVDHLLVGGPNPGLLRGFADLEPDVQKNIASRAEPFNSLRSTKKAGVAEQDLVLRAAISSARRWREEARRERPDLVRRLTGSFFACASIAARVEVPCSTSGEFNARRVRWGRGIK